MEHLLSNRTVFPGGVGGFDTTISARPIGGFSRVMMSSNTAPTILWLVFKRF
jgi:hypothetical protein